MPSRPTELNAHRIIKPARPRRVRRAIETRIDWAALLAQATRLEPAGIRNGAPIGQLDKLAAHYGTDPTRFLNWIRYLAFTRDGRIAKNASYLELCL